MNQSNRSKTSSSARRSAGRKSAVNRAIDSVFEPLESRRMFSVTAVFGSGVLTVLGDSTNNAITVSRDPAGRLFVNGGAVNIVGGTPTVANTTLIQAFGQAGNDSIALDEANGALPQANLFGG